MLKVVFVDPNCGTTRTSLLKSILETFAPSVPDWSDDGPSVAVRLGTLDCAAHTARDSHVLIHGISGQVAGQIKAALPAGMKEVVKLFWGNFSDAKFVVNEL